MKQIPFPPTDRLQELEFHFLVSREIDHEIECCLHDHKNLSATLESVFAYLRRRFTPLAAFFRTQNEDLALQLFADGIPGSQIESGCPTLLSVNEPTRLLTEGRDWFAMPLDLAGENIGTFGLAFPQGLCSKAEPVFMLMETVAEELDNYFFTIRESRFKHMMIMEIQRCLKSRMLNEALDMTINILADVVPIQDLILLFLDEDLAGDKVVQYTIYRDFKKTYDSQEKPMPELEALIGSGKQIVVPGNKDLEKIFALDGAAETVLLDGLVEETLVGKLLLVPPPNVGLSVSSREIIQVFAESLRQRLVDFNREKNVLRQFFSAEVIGKLLRIPGYKNRFLSPRKEDIGIIFADISGFTKMSEQVLKDPARIATFVDAWSKGVVENFFPLGGVLDKLVGDCIIVLFGPPFYDQVPTAIAQKLLEAAMAIRQFTREFLSAPENRDIQGSEFFPDFGVAIGVNFCSADVGIIGPNQDLTAFSSGMNNTARLQGLAHCNEILVTPAVKALVEQTADQPYVFEGPFATKVKNVQEPLPYFKLVKPT